MATLTSMANNYVQALSVANRAQSLTGVQSYRSLSNDVTRQPSDALQAQGDSARVKLSAVSQAAAGVAGVRDTAKSMQDSEKTTNTVDGARKSVEDFVKAYNNQQNTASRLTDRGSSAEERAPGALSGDTRIQAASNDVRQSVTSDQSSLSKLGVTVNNDGTLSFDSAAFDKAYAADAAGTQKAMAAVGKSAETVATKQLDTTGGMGAAQATAKAELSMVESRQSMIQSQLGNVYSYQQVQAKLDDITKQFQEYQKQQQNKVNSTGASASTTATTSSTSSASALSSNQASSTSAANTLSALNSGQSSTQQVTGNDAISQGSMMSSMIASQVANYQKVFAL
jgi:hypothetical protein